MYNSENLSQSNLPNDPVKGGQGSIKLTPPPTDALIFPSPSDVTAKKNKFKKKIEKKLICDILLLNPNDNWNKVDKSYVYSIPNCDSVLIVTHPTDEWCKCKESDVKTHEDTHVHFDHTFIQAEIKKWKRHQAKINNLPKDDYYEIKEGINGPFVIFNYEHFETTANTCRKDASKMALDMAETAIFLGFSPVRIYNDLKKSDTIILLEKISESSYENVNCIACYVSSHGNNNSEYYCRNGGKSSMSDFESYIGGTLCKSYCKAPRMFFYDMCLGTGAGTAKESKIESDVAPEEYFNSASVPLSADVLTVFSTTHGNVSYRGIFNHALCKTFTENCDQELSVIIRKLNKMMSTYEAQGDVKQMPTPINKMTEEFYFYPKKSKARGRELNRHDEKQPMMPRDENLVVQAESKV